MSFEADLSLPEIARRQRQRGYARTAYWKHRHGCPPPAALYPDRRLSLERPARHYPACVAGAWWAQGTPEQRLAALEAKLNREQPLPRPR